MQFCRNGIRSPTGRCPDLMQFNQYALAVELVIIITYTHCNAVHTLRYPLSTMSVYQSINESPSVMSFCVATRSFICLHCCHFGR